MSVSESGKTAGVARSVSRRLSSTSVTVACCLLFAGLLTTCGFHPRGSFIRATEMRSVFVDAERDLSFDAEIREALLESSFTLATNRDDALILLRLDNESQDQRVVSVTSDGRVSELELKQTIDMLVAQSADGEALPVYRPDQQANTVAVTREYTFDETGVLGKENEARILREEMRQDLVRQILLRLIASLNPSISG